MILVTGAAGKTGLAIIRAIAAKGPPVRALVHREEQVEKVAAVGARDWIIGDMRSEAILEQAVRGVRAVYHICPNVSPDEVTIGHKIVAAAQEAGVELFVYHSVLHPQVEAMPHHWSKMRVEAMLFEAGLAYTILQPASYMQNILTGWRSIVEDGIYIVPYPPATRLGMVDLEDVGAAACTVLTEPSHAGATYELAGPEVLTQSEVAEVLGRQLGRSVRAVQVAIDAWVDRAKASGLGDYQIGMLMKMFGYYERFGFWGNPRVLAHLLGRVPNTLEMFVARTVQAHSKQS